MSKVISTITQEERARLAEIAAARKALLAAVAARPESKLEREIKIVSRGIGIRPPGGLGLRMSKEELDQEELLVKDHNDIVRAIRARRAEKLQARNNAAAVAKIRAQACPICFASHAGEC